MKCYAHYGLTDFIVLGGYRVGFIRQFFLNYRMYFSDFTIDMSNGESALIVITGFGKAWIRFETNRCSKISGRRKRTVQSLEGLMEVDFSFLEL